MSRMINVILTDGVIATVPALLINDLIKLREIVALERAEGWAYLDEAPMRKKLKYIDGPGRRSYDVYLAGS